MDQSEDGEDDGDFRSKFKEWMEAQGSVTQALSIPNDVGIFKFPHVVKESINEHMLL